MTDAPKSPSDAAASHGRVLQKVNDRLKELVASLRSEKQRLEVGSRALAVAAPPAPAPPAGDAVDLEKRRLAAELSLAREAVAEADAERARLRDRLAELEVENQRICDEYVAVQEESTVLAQLYVALERIHGGLSRAETLEALQEIVVNFVGSEELAVFDRRGDALVLTRSFGTDAAAFRHVRVGEGAIGRAVASGRLYVAGRDGAPSPGEEELTAAIPLWAGGEVVGAIAIFRMLGHKAGLGQGDQALFDLLSAHAGLALHLRAAPERPAAR